MEKWWIILYNCCNKENEKMQVFLLFFIFMIEFCMYLKFQIGGI